MNKVVIIITMAATLFTGSCSQHIGEPAFSELKKGFLNPPDSARPGVYWFIMDGNISKQGITSDLESMKAAGAGEASRFFHSESLAGLSMSHESET